ncbi:uracil-DNA glycosylase family protein [Hansschlegelia sp.]|uniref:uracil-DNA glycosylase family protein n=1 Tax=Hansschlegelia sp. TaxID=2041892 RepID=UPI002CFF0AB0|nr:uracil-DNA glycosylase family protein [Hansschlegelia sp.]HVI28383.1 uracil-DNA glycosylase family protein [Hansschlegelia sp.]
MDGQPEAEAKLDALLARVRACRICRDAPLRRPLPHAPRPVVRARATARIAICGQAPGTRVHASGVPFSDPSGVRLRRWLGMTDEEFYDESRVAIVPMGFCFPGLTPDGADLPPRRECAPAWRAAVFAELPKVELVLAIGRPAQLWHLGADAGNSLTETVARWREYLERPGPLRIAPLPHPSWRNNAWLKKNPWFEEETAPALRRLVRAAFDR